LNPILVAKGAKGWAPGSRNDQEFLYWYWLCAINSHLRHQHFWRPAKRIDIAGCVETCSTKSARSRLAV